MRTTPPELIEARLAVARDWGRLRELVEAETGFGWRRRSWSLLAVAFCAGLALAAGGRRVPGRDRDPVRRPGAS